MFGASPAGFTDTLTLDPLALTASHGADALAVNAGPDTATTCGAGIGPPCVYRKTTRPGFGVSGDGASGVLSLIFAKKMSPPPPYVL